MEVLVLVLKLVVVLQKHVSPTFLMYKTQDTIILLSNSETPSYRFQK